MCTSVADSHAAMLDDPASQRMQWRTIRACTSLARTDNCKVVQCLHRVIDMSLPRDESHNTMS